MYKLYHGENIFLSLRAVHNTLNQEFSNNDIIQIDADTLSADKIIDSIYSPSLFSTPKIYFVKRVYKNKERKTLLEDLLNILSTKNISMLIWEDQKIKSNTKY